jgi:hypothetical protein
MIGRILRSGLTRLAIATLALVGCRDSVAPRPVVDDAQPPNSGIAFSAGGAANVVGGTLALDQSNSTLWESGTMLIKGFNPTNPHRGDAIIATFIWTGSTNIITSVTDVLTAPGFPVVGNTYNLVEYVTSGGISMATYLATNVQNFPDPNNPADGVVLAVRALLSEPVADGGAVLSAYGGIAVELGQHRSASGSGSTPTVAAPGAIAVNAGGLAYGVSFSDGVVGMSPPTGLTNIINTSDNFFKGDAAYAVLPSAGSVDPQWTWFFSTPKTWLASAVALRPAATRLAFTVQPATTLPGQPIQPAVKVTALDDLGNPVPTFTGEVTIAIANNGGLLVPGTLSGTKTVTLVNGVATFADLSIDQLGNGYTLRATTGGLTAAVSAAFNIGL